MIHCWINVTVVVRTPSPEYSSVKISILIRGQNRALITKFCTCTLMLVLNLMYYMPRTEENNTYGTISFPLKKAKPKLAWASRTNDSEVASPNSFRSASGLVQDTAFPL